MRAKGGKYLPRSRSFVLNLPTDNKGKRGENRTGVNIPFIPFLALYEEKASITDARKFLKFCIPILSICHVKLCYCMNNRPCEIIRVVLKNILKFSFGS